MSEHFDVVIVGAGMAGSGMACALSQQTSLAIALVETSTLREGVPESEDRIDGFDARVSALTVASQRWLEELGIWSPIESQRISPFEKMQVWDGDTLASKPSIRSPQAAKPRLTVSQQA